MSGTTVRHHKTSEKVSHTASGWITAELLASLPEGLKMRDELLHSSQTQAETMCLSGPVWSWKEREQKSHLELGSSKLGRRGLRKVEKKKGGSGGGDFRKSASELFWTGDRSVEMEWCMWQGEGTIDTETLPIGNCDNVRKMFRSPILICIIPLGYNYIYSFPMKVNFRMNPLILYWKKNHNIHQQVNHWIYSLMCFCRSY